LQITGYSIDANGDINNDGYDDLIVGDDWKIKIYLGSEIFDTDYDLSIDDIDSIGFTFYTSIAGDLNNDGYDEIFAFAPNYPDPESPVGRAFIYSYNKLNDLKDKPDDHLNEFHLNQNYPNPFNPSTTISYQLSRAGLVILKVYDVLGREVTTLVDEQKQTGRYTIEFNADNLPGSKAELPSGVYLYQLRVNDYVSSKKMLLIK
jgi:hypothetical protein